MNIHQMLLNTEINKNIKIVLINSYPRSASVFLLSLIYKIVNEKIDGSSIHLPGLIGIKEASTCTIFRDPIDSINSHLYQGYGTGQSIDSLISHDMIKHQCVSYMSYIDSVNLNNSYFTSFELIKNNPVEEAIRFLNNKSIKVNSSLIESVAAHDIWNYSDIPENDLYAGHYPRSANLEEPYLKIRSALEQSDIIAETRDAYFKQIKDCQR